MNSTSCQCNVLIEMASFIYIKLLFLFSSMYYVICELNLSEGSACVSEGVNGTCVSVYRCQRAAIIYIYSNAGFAEEFPQFNEICRYKDGVPIVCCTDCAIYNEEKYKDYYIDIWKNFKKKSGSKSFFKCMDYYQYLPYRCRYSRDKILYYHEEFDERKLCHRVIGVGSLILTGEGGRDAERGELPHMALLGYGENHRDAKWLCGGSIISEMFILTAGHCLHHHDHGFVSFAALGILKRSDPRELWKIYKIKEMYRHPDYKPPSKYHDIALLETETEINFGRNILPACLNSAENDFSDISADAPGWGELGDGQPLADHLQIMSLDLFNDTDCIVHFPPVARHLAQGYDNTTQMCYGRADKVVDTCHGDSGGPLQVIYGECLYVVLGVTSLGIRNCAILGVPGVFTRKEQMERFHQDLKTMEERYQGQSDRHIMADNCWGSACVNEGVNGTCVSVYRCQRAAVIYTYSNAGFAQKLPQFNEICSYKDGVPVVCCTDCDIYDEEKYKDYYIDSWLDFMKKTGIKSFDKCMDYYQHLPYRCRDPKEIILGFREVFDETELCHNFIRLTIGRLAGEGGRNAERRELPHMALLGFGENHRDAEWLCGGSIISEKFILTAGHCLHHHDHGFVSFAALGILKRSDPRELWKIYKIKEMYRHPDYKPPSKYHDIALLETETEINFGRNILPACLNSAKNYFSDISADAPGWGEMGDGKSVANHLQIMTLDPFNDTDCMVHFPPVAKHLARGYDNTTQMCYGRADKVVDTCHGDSGGPLQVINGECLYVVLGITSLGIRNCAILGVPGVFTRVAPYVSWIESIVWKD